MPSITRFNDTDKTISIDTVLADAEVIHFEGFSGGMIFVPAGSALTSIAWYACATVDGTYLPIYNGLGTAVTSTVAASEAIPLPAACFGALFLKGVGNADGTVGLSLKV